MSSSRADLARSARRIEEMPTHDGSVLDCLAGALLRVFTRINRLEADHARVISRLAALELSRPVAGNGAAPAPASSSTAPGRGSYPPGQPAPGRRLTKEELR
jgi:hypothetical protein